MKYQVVSVQSSDFIKAIKELQEKVQEYCDNGWIPHGGLSVVTKSYEFYYVAQAMTHYTLE